MHPSAKKQVRNRPNSVKALDNIRDAYYCEQAGQDEKAFHHYQTAIQSPLLASAHKALAHFRIAALWRYERYTNLSADEAKQHYDQAFLLGYKNDSEDFTREEFIAIFHEKKALVFFNTQEYARAKKEYCCATEQIRKQQTPLHDTDPKKGLLVAKEAQLLCGVGVCHANLNQISEAERCYQEAVARCDVLGKEKVALSEGTTIDMEAYERLGNLYVSQYRYDKAHAVLNKSIQNIKNSPGEKGVAHFVIADLRLNGKIHLDDKKTEEHYQAAIAYQVPHAKDFYTLYKGLCCARKSAFKEATTYFNQAKNSDNPTCKIQALNNLGICYATLGQRRLAFEAHEACVDYYLGAIKTKRKVPDACREVVANTARHAAFCLDDLSNTAVTPSPQKAFWYYQQACELGSDPDNFHDLAFKYAEGEGTTRDPDKAITLYRRAIELYKLTGRSGASATQKSLGVLLINHPEKNGVEEGVACLYEAAKHQPQAWDRLGYYYLLGRVPTSNGVWESEVISSFKPNLQKAKECFDQAIAQGYDVAKLGLVALYLNAENIDMSLQERLSGAEKYCLELLNVEEKEVAEVVNNNLAIIYHGKLMLAEGSDIELYARKTLEFVKKTRRKHDIDILLRADKKLDVHEIERVKSLKLKVHYFGVSVNKRIVGIVRERDRTQTAIEEILHHYEMAKTENTLKSWDSVNFATSILNLGRLTEECLEHRTFHTRVLPRILDMLTTLKEKRSTVDFKVRSIVDCVEGMSKLHLHSGVQEHRELVQLFYRDAVTKLEQLTLQDKVRLIFSATRLDPRLSLFKTDVSRWFESVSFLSHPGAGIMFKATPKAIEAFGSLKGAELPCLIESALKDCSEGDDQALANLAYSLKFFDNADFDYRKLEGFDRFIRLLQTRFSERDEKQEGEGYLISLHQVYLALSYFHKKYPEMGIQERHLKTWYDDLKSMKHSEMVSPFQSEVVTFIRPYCDSVEEEKPVDLSPIDAVVRINGKEHYLQVDGSVHYLHGKAGQAPVLNLATRFRNTYLEQVTGQAPVCVSCYEWPKDSDDEKRKFFLEKKKIELKQEEKWEEVPGYKH